MNVLHLSTHDSTGGAARAAFRLHDGLERNGVASRMHVLFKQSKKNSVCMDRALTNRAYARLRSVSDDWPARLYGEYRERKQAPFSVAWAPDRVLAHIGAKSDVIHLHWINEGFVRIETLSEMDKPIVWTLHDSWPFTGGCHIPGTCTKYRLRCGACPALGSNQMLDLSRWVWQRKKRAWDNLNLILVAPSRWMAESARQSSLMQSYPIHVIPHGLNTEVYKPIEARHARQILNLPLDKNILLFGALGGSQDQNKGFNKLVEALEILAQTGATSDTIIAIFGEERPPHPPDLRLPLTYLGRYHDDVALALAYAAADAMVVPSLQESFGQTASEALACGTPVVAFNATGLKDVVDHKENGYLAEPYVSCDLAHGITWVLEDDSRRRRLSERAREKAVHAFSLERQAQKHIELYEDILNVARG